MNKIILLAASFALSCAFSCALLAAPTFAQAAETTGAAPAHVTPLSTQEFVTEAANANRFEIQAGRLAERKAQKQPERSFAHKMIADHRMANDQLAALIDSGAVRAELPAALDSDHREKLIQLQNLSGKQFDQAYDEMQKTGHGAAVMAFRNYGRSGDNARLRQWAQQTLPTLEKHLGMAKTLK